MSDCKRSLAKFNIGFMEVDPKKGKGVTWVSTQRTELGVETGDIIKFYLGETSRPSATVVVFPIDNEFFDKPMICLKAHESAEMVIAAATKDKKTGIGVFYCKDPKSPGESFAPILTVRVTR